MDARFLRDLSVTPGVYVEHDTRTKADDLCAQGLGPPTPNQPHGGGVDVSKCALPFHTLVPDFPGKF